MGSNVHFATRAIYHMRAAAVSDALQRVQFVLKANFNPNQPRVPAGESAGGQWIDTGIGTSKRPSSPHLVHLIADTPRPYQVDLQTEEGHFGAHTIDRHVGRRTDEILVEMGPTAHWWEPGRFVMRRNGTFRTLDEANYYVNDILRENTDTINAYISGIETRRLFLTKDYGYKTGVEWYRSDAYTDPILRDTYGVGVAIARAPKHRFGFVVLTAFPRNDDLGDLKMDNRIAMNPAFKTFARYLYADPKNYNSLADIAKAGLDGVPANELVSLISFIDDVLSRNYSERQFADLWARSPADILVAGRVTPELFTLVKKLAAKRTRSRT